MVELLHERVPEKLKNDHIFLFHMVFLGGGRALHTFIPGPQFSPFCCSIVYFFSVTKDRL